MIAYAAAVACGCAPPTDDGGGVDAVPVFPNDYRATYRLVRDCRGSIEHAATIRVYVNEIGADAYLADANPLPLGTVVVKEEFVGTGCDNDEELAVWSAMLKREPGFDSADGDWQWQEVIAPNRRVRLDDKTTCIQCHREPECLKRDLMCAIP
ncbi:MAG: hypothetical protein HOP29_09030 [Phycisphaerales bacterium]|nr:hypothetical protein [Phycisphaerales bacterium]